MVYPHPVPQCVVIIFYAKCQQESGMQCTACRAAASLVICQSAKGSCHYFYLRRHSNSQTLFFRFPHYTTGWLAVLSTEYQSTLCFLWVYLQ